MSNQNFTVTLDFINANGDGDQFVPRMSPASVTVPESSTAVITFQLGANSIDAGYYFAGYVDQTVYSNKRPYESELQGTGVPDTHGTQFQITDANTYVGALQVTLFLRNFNNSSVQISYDPQIVNNGQ